MLRSRYLYFVKHFGRRQASVLLWGVRAALLARAGKAALATLRGGGGQAGKAALLRALAAYDPRTPLSHERSSNSLTSVGV